ncbi:MAG: polysaccharide deacetylase family protein [Candidatus Cyclobacteriaceae bacterium M3_2C_046]
MKVINYMGSLKWILLFLFYSGWLLAQPEKDIRLIVRGDDIGCSHTVNMACINSYQNGIMKSVEVMVPTPWFEHAVDLLNQHPGLDVGVHLTLTSEWENLKWRPLTWAPSLTDQDGYFFPMIWPNDSYGPEQALKEQNWQIDQIEQELRTQLDLARKKIPQISHISCHMGCNNLSPEVDALVKKLAREYQLEIDLEKHQVQKVTYQGPRNTPEQKIQSFINMLNELKPGTYLFVDHPGYYREEMKAMHHVGYTQVALDREGVTQTFTSPAVKAVIEERGIQLISYQDLNN